MQALEQKVKLRLDKLMGPERRIDLLDCNFMKDLSLNLQNEYQDELEKKLHERILHQRIKDRLEKSKKVEEIREGEEEEEEEEKSPRNVLSPEVLKEETEAAEEEMKEELDQDSSDEEQEQKEEADACFGEEIDESWTVDEDAEGLMASYRKDPPYVAPAEEAPVPEKESITTRSSSQPSIDTILSSALFKHEEEFQKYIPPMISEMEKEESITNLYKLGNLCVKTYGGLKPLSEKEMEEFEKESICSENSDDMVFLKAEPGFDSRRGSIASFSELDSSLEEEDDSEKNETESTSMRGNMLRKSEFLLIQEEEEEQATEKEKEEEEEQRRGRKR